MTPKTDQNTMNELALAPATIAPATVPPPVDVAQLDTAKPLAEIFQPFQTTLDKWEAKAKSLKVTDINQKTEMAQARLARLELKEARVTMDKTRKGLVEGLKARTGKIDDTARTIRVKMEELEAELLESEQFAERHAAQLKAELKQKREAALLPFLDAPVVTDLSSLSEEDFAKVLSDAQLLRQARIDAAAKAEAERKAKEEADRIERERIAAENARLKAEAEEERQRIQRIEAERAEERRKAKEEADRIAAAAEAERKRIEAERAEERRKVEAEAERKAEEARKEREAIEAKAKAEAAKAAKEAARLKAELEARQKEDAARIANEKAAAEAERARVEVERAAAEEARRQAAAAPDAAKLKAFAATLRALELPTLNNGTVNTQLAEQTEKFAKWVETQIPKLTL